jgi:hypothetical protein
LFMQLANNPSGDRRTRAEIPREARRSLVISGRMF